MVIRLLAWGMILSLAVHAGPWLRNVSVLGRLAQTHPQCGSPWQIHVLSHYLFLQGLPYAFRYVRALMRSLSLEYRKYTTTRVPTLSLSEGMDVNRPIRQERHY